MSGWKVIAQGSAGVRISRCPGGRIHLNCGDVTLRFSKEDFSAFADVVGRAAANLGGFQLPLRSAANLDELQLQQWLAALSRGEYTFTFSNN